MAHKKWNPKRIFKASHLNAQRSLREIEAFCGNADIGHIRYRYEVAKFAEFNVVWHRWAGFPVISIAQCRSIQCGPRSQARGVAIVGLGTHKVSRWSKSAVPAILHLVIKKNYDTGQTAITNGYWTHAFVSPILETSFTGYRTTRYPVKPTEFANGRNKRHRTQASGPRNNLSR